MKFFERFKKEKNISTDILNQPETVADNDTQETGQQTVEEIQDEKAVQKDRIISYVIAGVVILVTVAVIWGAWRNQKATAPVPPSVPVDNPTAALNNALDKLSGKEDIYYRVTGSKRSTFGGNTYQENYSQLVYLEGVNSPDMKGLVEETAQIGDHTIRSIEVFLGGTGYFTTANAKYQAPIEKDAYLARYAPLQLVDPTLYSDITGTVSSGEKTVTLRTPSAPEKWIADTGITMLSVEAQVALNNRNELVSTTYTITYEKDGMTIYLSLKAEPLDWAAPAFPTIVAKDFIQVSDLNIPKTLERSIGYLTSATSIHAEYDEHIYVEAFGDDRTKSIRMTVSQESNGWSAQIRTVTTPSNSSKPGAMSPTKTDEKFTGGVYTYSINDSEYVASENITQEIMENNCQNLLVMTIPLLEHIATFEITTEDNVLCINLTPTEDYAKVLAEDAFLEMYNADHPETLASEYVTNTVFAYIRLDMNTGFPLASGYSYKGTNTQENLTYQLVFDAAQTYTTTVK